MKRVLIFSLAYYPHFPSGAEVALKEITGRIAPQDIEFHMVTLRYRKDLPKEEKLGNVTVHRIGIAVSNPNITREDLGRWPLDVNKPLYQFLAAYTALKLHRTYRFDATWALMAHSAGVPAALFKFFKPSVPVILTLQEGDPPGFIEKKMRPLWPLFSYAFAHADVVQTISTFLAAWARRRGFTGTPEVIPNGASVQSALEYPQAELDALKEEVGKKEGDVFLISVARLEHQKAIDDVIRALPLLPAHIRYLVVGNGSQRKALEALVGELGLTDRVIFAGEVDRTMTAKYRRISDIFVLPSRSEGMGNSFASTMVSGLPIIATQEGGLADLIFDAKRNPDKPATAWAVDKDNPGQIVAAVKEILSHPEEVKKVTETAKKFAQDNFDWDTIAKAMQTRVFAVAFAKALRK